MTGTPLVVPEQLPAFSDLYMLDTVLARLQVTLDEACQKGDVDLRSGDGSDLLRALDISAEQLPVVGLLNLIQALAHATRLVHLLRTMSLQLFVILRVWRKYKGANKISQQKYYIWDRDKSHYSVFPDGACCRK